MIGVIIFARTSSTRLPSKVLIKIQNYSIIEHIINRVTKSNLVEKTILATTTNEKDDQLVKIAKDSKIDFFRGSEFDVLGRCYDTAKKYSLDPIIRITGDDPIKDPSIIDQAIKIYLGDPKKYDLICNTLKPSFPEGLDVELIPFRTLEKVWKTAIKSEDREHITKFIFDNIDDFKIYNFKNSKDLSQIRLTLDTKEDLELIKNIYDFFYPSNNVFSWNEVVSYLESNPELLEINKDIKKSGRYQSENT